VAEAARRDPMRTSLFLAVALAGARRYDQVWPFLQGLFPDPVAAADPALTEAARIGYRLATEGWLGPAAAEAVVARLRTLVAAGPVPDVKAWVAATASLPMLPSLRNARGAERAARADVIRLEVLDAWCSGREPRVEGLLDPRPEPRDPKDDLDLPLESQAPGEAGGALADILRQLIDEGSPAEHELLRRDRALSRLVHGLGAKPERYLDEPVATIADLLSVGAFSDRARFEAVVLPIAGAYVAATAEALRNRVRLYEMTSVQVEADQTRFDVTAFGIPTDQVEAAAVAEAMRVMPDSGTHNPLARRREEADRADYFKGLVARYQMLIAAARDRVLGSRELVVAADRSCASIRAQVDARQRGAALASPPPPPPR
jgi:hypothetical protein